MEKDTVKVHCGCAPPPKDKEAEEEYRNWWVMELPDDLGMPAPGRQAWENCRGVLERTCHIYNSQKEGVFGRHASHCPSSSCMGTPTHNSLSLSTFLAYRAWTSLGFCLEWSGQPSEPFSQLRLLWWHDIHGKNERGNRFCTDRSLLCFLSSNSGVWFLRKQSVVAWFPWTRWQWSSLCLAMSDFESWFLRNQSAGVMVSMDEVRTDSTLIDLWVAMSDFDTFVALFFGTWSRWAPWWALSRELRLS